MPSVVKRDVATVVVKQVELDVVVFRAIQEDLVEGPVIRANRFRVLRFVRILNMVVSKLSSLRTGFSVS